MMKKLFILTGILFATLTFGQINTNQFLIGNVENSRFLFENDTKPVLDMSKPTKAETTNTEDYTNGNQDTLYCLIRDRNEYGDYKGTRAQFSVWKPKSGFSCCVIVNISRGNKIIARQRVTVTKNNMLRVLIGEVDGVTQGVSPCN